MNKKEKIAKPNLKSNKKSESKRAQNNKVVKRTISKSTLMLFISLVAIIIIVSLLIIFYKRDNIFGKGKPSVIDGLPQNRQEQYAIMSEEIAKNENVNIDGEKKVNISEELKKDKLMKEDPKVEVSQIKLELGNSTSLFTAKMKNDSNVDASPFRYTITFVNKEGKSLGIFEMESDYIIAGETNDIYLQSNDDISNAYNVIFEVKETYVYDALKGGFVNKEGKLIKK